MALVESYKKLLQFFQLLRAALEVKLRGCLYERFVKKFLKKFGFCTKIRILELT